MKRIKLVLLVMVMFGAGCVSYTCKDKANWAYTEFKRKGLTPTGIIVARIKGYGRDFHAMNWYTEDGEGGIWDQAYHCPRTTNDLSLVIRKREGPLTNWPACILPTMDQIKNYQK